MSKRSANFLGFVFASCVAPFNLALNAMSIEPNIDTLLDACIYVAASFLIFLPYAALAATVIGVPIYFVSKKLGIVTWWMATLAGSVAGACAALVMFGYASIPVDFLTYVLLGTVSGLVFWLVRSVATKEH